MRGFRLNEGYLRIEYFGNHLMKAWQILFVQLVVIHYFHVADRDWLDAVFCQMFHTVDHRLYRTVVVTVGMPEVTVEHKLLDCLVAVGVHAVENGFHRWRVSSIRTRFIVDESNHSVRSEEHTSELQSPY